MTPQPTSPVKASTQDFIDIEEVRDDIVLLRDHSCCTIISVRTTNYGLLSEEDQKALIYAFAGLLNSLSFPVQIAILSRKMDISSYLATLAGKIEAQKNETVKTQLADYREFIQATVKKNTILEKSFYFIIPFSALEMGIVASAKKSLDKNYVFTHAKTALLPKRDHLVRLLQRAGLGGKTLSQQEILSLFYRVYNPNSPETRLAPVMNYMSIATTT